MSNITKIAPYVYLAKRSSSGTIYDLYLLVPVSSRKTVDLTNVQPEAAAGARIFISYTSSGANLSEPAPKYAFKHWEIDSEGAYVDIHIQGDDSDDFTTIVTFADADTEPATSTNDQHTFAPYLFIGRKTEGGHMYFCPSTIVLFEGDAGAQSEALTFSNNGSSHEITPGDSGDLVTAAENFAVNQDVRHEISGTTYTFDGTVTAALAKPIRKGKIRNMWATAAKSNGQTSVLASEELANANV